MTSNEIEAALKDLKEEITGLKQQMPHDFAIRAGFNTRDELIGELQKEVNKLKQRVERLEAR